MPELRTRSTPALERALSILETLAEAPRGFSLSELTGKLHLPKSSLHCLLLTLERRGYLQRDSRAKRYMFGWKLFRLAHRLPAGARLREQAAPFLRNLMVRTRLTVHMGVLDRDGVVLIEKIEPPGLLRLATWVGKHMDTHCTGLGKALLAFLPSEEVDRLLREHGLPRHNENTLGSAVKLKRALAEIRAQGYAVDDEEDEIGLRCIGVPILARDGSPTAAVSIAGTTSQIHPGNLPQLTSIVKQTAKAIAATENGGRRWQENSCLDE